MTTPQDVCRDCGHPRSEHERQEGNFDGVIFDRCRHAGCDCFADPDDKEQYANA